MRPPNPGYGNEHRAWPGEGYQPAAGSLAEPAQQAGRDAAAQPPRPKGPPAALPAGSAAPENGVQHDGAGHATDVAEVASPTGKKPPPAAGLTPAAPPPRPTGATAGQDAPTDDDTAPLPAMSFDGPDGDSASPAHNPVSEHAERIVPPGWRPEESEARSQDPAEQAQASRIRDPFEPPDRQAIPGMAELAEEQRRSASRAASSLPTRTPPGQGRGTPQAATGEKPGPPGAAKMEQIKDLYLTAEALGEDALNQHFEQVSERQRQLIREYFDQVVDRAPDRKAQS